MGIVVWQRQGMLQGMSFQITAPVISLRRTLQVGSRSVSMSKSMHPGQKGLQSEESVKRQKTFLVKVWKSTSNLNAHYVVYGVAKGVNRVGG